MKRILPAIFAISVGQTMAADVAIDAATHCLNSNLMTGAAATADLPAGKYRVSLIGNTMRCNSFSPDASCAIDTVVMRAIEYSKKPNGALWGLSVKSSSVINVRAESARVQAFVMDEACGDNIGAATLHFEPLN